MSKLLDNQTFKKSMKYVNNVEPDKTISFNISLSCNHEISKEILTTIEQVVNNILIDNYTEKQSYMMKAKELEAQEKEVKSHEELNKAIQEETMKAQQTMIKNTGKLMAKAKKTDKVH
jgi:hypothetical protein